MRTAHLTASTSAAAIAAAFPRGPRIAFAPDDGRGAVAGSGMGVPKRDIVRNDAVETKPAARKDGARKDEGAPPEGDDKLDKLLSMMTSIQENQQATAARLDALEKGKEGTTKDPDDLTEAEREEMVKADGLGLSMIEREMGAIKGRMSYVERQRAEMAKEAELAKIQMRADAVANLHGRRAPAPMTGETLDAFKIRCLKEHQKFSPAYKAVDLGVIARTEPVAFAAIEDQIYTDSSEASKRPMGPEDGSLMERTRIDESGRKVKEFFGNQSFVKRLTPPTRHVRTFNTTGQPLQHVFSA